MIAVVRFIGISYPKSQGGALNDRGCHKHHRQAIGEELLGLYVVFFFVIAQLISWLFFKQLPKIIHCN
jgi:hypothetical protein